MGSYPHEPFQTMIYRLFPYLRDTAIDETMEVSLPGLFLRDEPPKSPEEWMRLFRTKLINIPPEGKITAEVAAALLVLENPAELINAIFTDPAQALLAIGSIGADMSDEERTESEQTIVAAVIAGQAAVTAAASAAGAAGAYRRKP